MYKIQAVVKMNYSNGNIWALQKRNYCVDSLLSVN
jgi:hypothetical protein